MQLLVFKKRARFVVDDKVVTRLLILSFSHYMLAHFLCSSGTNLLSFPCVCTTSVASLGFQHHYPLSVEYLAFTLIYHHTHSVVFLKPTVSSTPLVPPSNSHKCLRFTSATEVFFSATEVFLAHTGAIQIRLLLLLL